MSRPGLAADDPWGVDNLPYGSLVGHGNRRFAAVRIGEHALDLTRATAVEAPGLARLVADGSLDGLLAAGRHVWDEVRGLVRAWLTDEAHAATIEPLLVPLADTAPVLPFTVADYVDFYASQDHAANVGRIFRPGAEPLPANWKHLPVGYHGRAGTVVVSGTDVLRPQGQYRTSEGVAFGPSRRLDFEAEVAFVVGTGTASGESVPVGAFADHVFGVCLLNDWSARDIQSWEYVPLGPFLGKSFATSISAWITPLAALDRAWVAPPARDPRPLPYLDDSAAPSALDLALEVRLNGEPISRPPFAGMYWTGPQQLAHLTVNGARLRPGDVFASGTVSGPEPGQRGCLLELTWNGAEPITLPDDSRRTFLHDGDEVLLTATAPGPRGRIALGEVRGTVVSGLRSSGGL